MCFPSNAKEIDLMLSFFKKQKNSKNSSFDFLLLIMANHQLKYSILYVWKILMWEGDDERIIIIMNDLRVHKGLSANSFGHA